jgi:transcriptional regulator with XRE-family HTH domain
MDWYGMTDAVLAAEIGKRIKATRLKKKFTQGDIAERSGLSVFTISQIENGKNSSLSSLIAVLRVLRLLENLEELFPEPVLSPVDLLDRQYTGKKSAKTSNTRKR